MEAVLADSAYTGASADLVADRDTARRIRACSRTGVEVGCIGVHGDVIQIRVTVGTGVFRDASWPSRLLRNASGGGGGRRRPRSSKDGTCAVDVRFGCRS